MTTLAEQQLREAVARDPRVLRAVDRELLALCLAATTAVLDPEAQRNHARAAIAAGASAGQLTDSVLIATVIGFHSLTQGVPAITAELEAAGLLEDAGEDDPARRLLRDRFVDDDNPYWQRFERELPGSLDGLLRLSPGGYEHFMAFSALPSRRRSLTPLLMELMYVGIDCLPTHTYLPGLRFHAHNAVERGASADALAETILLAARDAQPPSGVVVEAVAAALDAAAARPTTTTHQAGSTA